MHELLRAEQNAKVQGYCLRKLIAYIGAETTEKSMNAA